MQEKLVILIPVFNDWDSLRVLITQLETEKSGVYPPNTTLLVVDDGSTQNAPLKKTGAFTIEVLHLNRNIGHQKAIAIGMAYAQAQLQPDTLVIMDSDGEDRPEDVPVLLKAAAENPGKVVFAHRARRNEGFTFRIFYWLYKCCFRIFTGRAISFGNFSVIPQNLLNRLVHYSELWNHIPGGILKSGLPYIAVPTTRGKRIAGLSKMNFTALLLHGLGAIAVFIDVIATRLLIFSVSMISISVLAILIIFGIRTFTDWAVPGWASTLMSSMFIILLQSFLLSLFTIFLYLSSQSQRKFIPARHYTDYTGHTEKTEG
jgi:polyisoprenyl-phosphate glycosyltransferase